MDGWMRARARTHTHTHTHLGRGGGVDQQQHRGGDMPILHANGAVQVRGSLQVPPPAARSRPGSVLPGLLQQWFLTSLTIVVYYTSNPQVHHPPRDLAGWSRQCPSWHLPFVAIVVSSSQCPPLPLTTVVVVCFVVTMFSLASGRGSIHPPLLQQWQCPPVYHSVLLFTTLSFCLQQR